MINTHLALSLCDGSVISLQDTVILGRGRPAIFSNACISRKQYKVSMLEDRQGHADREGLQLEVMGMHDVIVEAMDKDGTAWHPVARLSPGQHFQPLLPGHRFFVAGLRDESLVTVVEACAAATATAPPAAASSPSNLKQLQLSAPNQLHPDAAAATPSTSTSMIYSDQKHTNGAGEAEALPGVTSVASHRASVVAATVGGPADPPERPHASGQAGMDVVDLTMTDDDDNEAAGVAHGTASQVAGAGQPTDAAGSSHQPATGSCPAAGPSSGSHDGPPSKRARVDQQGQVPPVAGSRPPSQPVPSFPGQSHVPEPSGAVFSLFYVKGVAPGWNRGCLGVKLWELVREGFQLAVVMNMMIDMQWLLSACPQLTRGGHVIICHGARSEEGHAALQLPCEQQGLHDITVHAPPLPIEYGSHHTKAILLRYAGGLRVIIHSANLIYGDCNNKTQGVWWQDFPPKDGDSPHTSPFERDLANYCTQLKLPPQAALRVQQMIAAHDLSSARVHLVPSIPGRHSGRSLHMYGHMRLRALLQQEPLPRPAWARSSSFIIQCSSLGSLTEKWLLEEFGVSLASHAQPQQQAAPAQPGTHPTGANPSGGSHAHAALMRGAAAAARMDPARLSFVWPAVSEVRNSLEGWAAGGSIPGPEKNVSKPFLARHFCTFGGRPAGRMRAMPHIKTCCRFMGQQLAWAMVGSHNLSKAAWGELQKNGTQLFIRSFELSTLHTPSLEAAYLRHRHCGFSLTTASAVPRSIPAACSADCAGGLCAATAQHTARGPGPRSEEAAAGQHTAAAATAAATATAPATATATAAPAVELWSLASFERTPSAAGQAVTPQLVGAQQEASAPGSSSSRQVPGSGIGTGSQVVKMVVPLPYSLPPEPYRRGPQSGNEGDGGDEPWMIDVMYEGLDILGRSRLQRTSQYGYVQD